jgi:hypothetical protein
MAERGDEETATRLRIVGARLRVLAEALAEPKADRAREEG